jgi:hypothetical protein
VDVGRKEHDVAHPVPLGVRQDAGELALTAQRRTAVALREALLGGAVGHDQAERQIVGDDLPGGLG